MSKTSETTFEQDLETLDAVVLALESGELGLDGSLKRFEEGVAVARRLRQRLDHAEGRVVELLSDGTTRDLSVD